MIRLRTPAHRHLVAMIAWVVAIDVLAVAVYYLAGIDAAAPRVRTAFTAVWTGATLVAVGVHLRRIRQARYGTRR